MEIKAKKTIIFVVLLAAVLGVLGTTAWVQRLSLAKNTALYLLEQQGFSTARLDVKLLDFDQLVIENVNIGDVLQADKLTAHYTVRGLLSGQIADLIIDKPAVDISNPDHEIFQKLTALAMGEEGAASGPDLKIPKISVHAFNVFEKQAQRSVEIQGDAQISSELELVLAATVKADLQTNSGVYRFSGGKIQAQGSLKTLEGSLKLEKGVFSQKGDNPQFVPLHIAADAKVANSELHFNGGVRTDNDVALINIAGDFNLTEGSGQALYDVVGFEFRKEGLQPHHLASGLKGVPPLDVTIDGKGRMAFENRTGEIRSEINFSHLNVQQDDNEVNAPKIKTTINVDWSAKEADFFIMGRLMAPKIMANAVGQNFEVSDVDFSINGNDFDRLNAKLRAVVNTAGKVVELPESNLFATSQYYEDKLHLEGTLKGSSNEYWIYFNGLHGLKTGVGQSLIDLKSLHFGGKFPKLATLSSYFGNIDKDAAGRATGYLSAEWDQDLDPKFKVYAKVKNLSLTQEGVDLKNTGFEVFSNEFQLNKPLTAQISHLHSDIGVNAQEIAVDADEFTVDLNQNWGEARISSPKISLTPGRGAIVKPRIDAAVSGTLNSDDLQLTADFSGDLLGKFAKIKAAYNLPKSQGKVDVSVPPILFGEGGVALNDLLQDDLGGLKLIGQIGADISVDLNGSDFDGSGRLRLSDLTVEQEGVRLAGINGNLQLDHLNPLQTASSQKITANLLDAGIAIKQPSLTFSIKQQNRQPVLKIDRMVMELFGGGAEIWDTIIDPYAKSNKVDILLSSLSLKELLALGDLGDVAASGSMRGKIPIEFDGEKIIVTDGILEAEGPGILNVRSEAARQALSSGGAQTKLLFDILENFNYAELSLSISKPASGEDVVTLHTKGANPDVENNRPVVLNVNLSTNLDRIFNTLLDGYRLSEKALRATLRARDK